MKRLKSGKLDLGVRRDILDWIWKVLRCLGFFHLTNTKQQSSSWMKRRDILDWIWKFHIAFNKQVAVEEIKKFEIFTKIVEDLRGQKIIKLSHT
ncbi:hypothetical protein DEO72_LG6g266 [Vigna unguiculata]|uniref:Uncharacterized protein n=1 Tax=Vigna unguiculata TaxID=3917 RepID=A0A4D6M2X5_VIGUN|nr:hypothetical protein DEO72_LG6g266 [Vigna unguiculata]